MSLLNSISLLRERPLARALLARSQQRLREMEWGKRKRSRRAPGVPWLPMYERDKEGAVEPFTFFQRTGKKIPLFGSSEGFGLDWAATQTRSFNPVPVGPRTGVAKRIKTNIHGRVKNFQPNLNIPRAPSHSRRFPSGPTDQRSFQGRRSAGGKWDGKIRAYEKRPSYLTKRGSSEETPGDVHKKELKREPYCFLT